MHQDKHTPKLYSSMNNMDLGAVPPTAINVGVPNLETDLFRNVNRLYPS